MGPRPDRRWCSALIVAAACGDNRTIGEDAAPVDARVECTPVRGTRADIRFVAYGCDHPLSPPRPGCMDGVVTLVTSPPGDRRLFALELEGRIRVIADGQVIAEPFLDLSDDLGGPVVADNELGLLGLAFHPAYATNRQFFVFYTADNPDPTDPMHPFVDVLERYTASATDPLRADPASGVVVLSIPDPFGNHNGGMIEFGNDGLLYIGTGDGGGAGDPQGNAQDPTALLGKMLRIDVDTRDPGREYAIPAGNPFAAGGGAPEVFMLGLRNPWRWSFDRATGDMWIGDVGQGEIEELDVLTPSEQPGANLGWHMYEGNNCYTPPCDATGMTFPLDSRTHLDGWWSIIGGQVYRGSCYPDLVGTYFYTDCFYGHMAAARLRGDGTLDVMDLPGDFIGGPASLHADSRGELYETDINGNIFQLVAGP